MQHFGVTTLKKDQMKLMIVAALLIVIVQVSVAIRSYSRYGGYGGYGYHPQPLHKREMSLKNLAERIRYLQKRNVKENQLRDVFESGSVL